MNQKDTNFKPVLFGAGFLLLVLIVGGGIGLFRQSRMASQRQAVAGIWEQIEAYYFYYEDYRDDLQAAREQIEQKINAGIGWQDYYTTLSEQLAAESIQISPPSEYQAACQVRPFFAGLRLVPSPEEGVAIVFYVLPQSPAEAAGFKFGDKILSINGAPALDAGGEIPCIDTTKNVQLSIYQAGGEPREVELPSSTQDLPFGGEAYRLEVGTNRFVSLIRIFGFDEYTPAIFQNVFEKASDAQTVGIVIDLRNAQEGNLQAMIVLLESFLPEDTTLRFTSRSGIVEFGVTTNAENEKYQGYPVVILVNGSTKGIPEIFAYEMQITGRAYVIGEATPGNFDRYQMGEIPGCCGVMMPTGRFIGAGDGLAGGVTPDRSVHTPTHSILMGTDETLEEGLNYFKDSSE